MEETDGLTRNGSPESQMETVCFLIGRGVGLAMVVVVLAVATPCASAMVLAFSAAAIACVCAMKSEIGLKTTLGLAVGRPNIRKQ